MRLQMSPSTAPASTDASWSLSPSRIRRARARQRFEELRREREIGHRRFVDDEHVERQRIAAIVAVADRIGPRAEQPVQREGFGGNHRAREEIDVEAVERRAHRVLHARRRLARRRRQPDRELARRAPVPRAARGSSRPSSSCRCPVRPRSRRSAAAPPSPRRASAPSRADRGSSARGLRAAVFRRRRRRRARARADLRRDASRSPSSDRDRAARFVEDERAEVARQADDTGFAQEPHPRHRAAARVILEARQRPAGVSPRDARRRRRCRSPGSRAPRRARAPGRSLAASTRR